MMLSGPVHRGTRLLKLFYYRFFSRALLPCLVGLALLLVSSCESDGNIQASLSLQLAPYQIFDFDAGVVEGHQSLSTEQIEASYAGRALIFVRVDAIDTRLGEFEISWADASDQSLRSVSQKSFYILRNEITQSQWQRVIGTTPWIDAIDDLEMSAGEGARYPVFGLSFVQAQAAANQFNGLSRRFTLRLPTPDEWELACYGGSPDNRLGGLGSFAWGGDVSLGIVEQYATVWETRTINAPLPVASKQAVFENFHDYHGNCWEFDNSGALRGGSWRDSLAATRVANRWIVDPDLAMPTASMRLVFVP